jgi:hypothetical protein
MDKIMRNLILCVHSLRVSIDDRLGQELKDMVNNPTEYFIKDVERNLQKHILFLFFAFVEKMCDKNQLIKIFDFCVF